MLLGIVGDLNIKFEKEILEAVTKQILIKFAATLSSFLKKHQTQKLDRWHGSINRKRNA